VRLILSFYINHKNIFFVKLHEYTWIVEMYLNFFLLEFLENLKYVFVWWERIHPGAELNRELCNF
jgi:hypothetical protein